MSVFIEQQNLPAVFSAIAAFMSLVFAAFSFWFGRQHQRRLAKIEWTRDVLAWGNECIDVISDAHLIVQFAPSCESSSLNQRYYDVLRRLTSLIDRGRMYFTNVDKHKYGQEKPDAYKGYRPKLLDPLVAAYNDIETLSHDNSVTISSSARLVQYRRIFVSDLQKEIPPEWFHRAKEYDRKDTPGREAGRPLN
ncbi:MAG: hypothetical protein HOL85_03355 [Rhodospirillaceae bacterium]|jgi:hypothetical protein|nr:hypothetical protein [Rhodospirillaceae bacterium]